MKRQELKLESRIAKKEATLNVSIAQVNYYQARYDAGGFGKLLKFNLGVFKRAVKQETKELEELRGKLK